MEEHRWVVPLPGLRGDVDVGRRGGFVPRGLVTDWVWGQGWDGSGVPGLWMIRSFTERGKMRAGWAERVNSALVLTREMPGRPSEAAEWAAGH